MGDNSKLNAFCALSKQKISGTFLFDKSISTGMVYQDKLEEFFMPIAEEDSPDDMLSE
jgi:hypothetical protein